MCDSHHPRMRRGYGYGFGHGPQHFMMFGDCCESGESTETKIKRLEAHKSLLQDRIASIEKMISELQQPSEGEEV